MYRERKKALIAMSGGVDSSTAARLMQAEGYDCIGCTMQLFEDEAHAGEREDARHVADILGMPFSVVHLEAAFRKHVMLPFAESYRNGQTPNPCVECNRCLKFGLLMDKCRQLACDCLVTGHYARVCRDEARGRYLLKKAADPAKDQSYVLYMLTQEQLAHVRFPLGELRKEEVRQIAAQENLGVDRKRESQDICFVPDGDYAGFIARFTETRAQENATVSGTDPEQAGDFVSRDGMVLGRHKGVIHYTLGQRRGLGIPAAQRLYVTAIDPETNTVTLGKNEDLFTRELSAGHINLISVDRITAPMRVQAKIRYRHTAQPAVVTQPDDDTLRVVFDAPQRAVTPGQSVVLYDGDIVVGGGVICQR